MEAKFIHPTDATDAPIADNSFDVLIVGAGPTGLTVANLLGQYRIKVLLIERNQGLYSFPRAISIDDEGLRICQALGLREQILQHVRLDTGALYLSHGKRLIYVKPRQQHNGYPLISTFDQPALERTLHAGLKRFPTVTVHFGQALQTFQQTAAASIRATLCSEIGEPQHITCTYLLACDGGKSSIRQTLKIPMRGRTFPQRWLVVDSQDQAEDEESTATREHITFFCDPERPAVSVPAPHQGRRWEFMLHPGESETNMLRPDTILKLIQQRTQAGTAQIQLQRQAIYTFHASRATAYRQGRVFLLGDAAHLLPPFGGQGMNCGLRDAHNLAWKLAIVLRKQANPNILDSYQQERAPHAAALIRFSAFMGQMVMPTNHSMAHLRDLVLGLLTRLPPGATSLNEMSIKPRSRYTRGLRLALGHTLTRRWHARLAGQLLPQPIVLTPDGIPTLLDEQLGTGFTLLRLYADPGSAFTALQAPLWKRIEIQLLCIVPATTSLQKISQENAYIQDNLQQQLAHWLDMRRDLYVLVRPDRYIYGAFTPAQEQTFVTVLQKSLFCNTLSYNK
ncbi:bifunctional 3-(3-hydroxy-phenyl)propionate/3-hydroxycinnamic acid hydroxylase MhpA [Dictyobacter arantiisoli]|uniref:3-(3-hydroxy-phenyl)propionate/3-hydroxycinnamic acid hydroxylase n=1 Tax=Dictyobacter arantiisoli TaxID=2014874 RepID=A0A5A5TIW0_9CHLR|nr:bifunctional 3-(3-hydroxy-phenyl)propionate/3-hydroxycinnamic acid hydroxylase [Dictyobacter arantiisoli]GCF11165.1 3-(3-hydroxy-phenyl)propionate/3-hydroxycinnamic acid hydroxylase [Dictyobacter arantiisoli]